MSPETLSLKAVSSETLLPITDNLTSQRQVRQQIALQFLAQQALSHKNIETLLETITETVSRLLEMPYCRSWQMLSDNATLQCITTTENLNYQRLPREIQGTDNALITEAKQLKRPFRLNHELILDNHTTSEIHPSERLEDDNHTPPRLSLAAPVISSFDQLHPPAFQAHHWQQQCMPQHCNHGILIPICGVDQELLALLELYDEQQNCDRSELEFLQSVAHLLATAIQRSRSEALLSTQSKVLEQLAAGNSLQGILTSICQLIEEQSLGAICSIFLLDESGKTISSSASTAQFPHQLSNAVVGSPLKDGAFPCATAMCRRETVLVENTATAPLWQSFGQVVEQYDIHSCWSTPFFSQKGDVLGSFAMLHRTACGPLQHHEQLIQTAIHLASITTDNRRAASQLQHQAEHDLLTGLHNRVSLLTMIQRQLKQEDNQPFAVVFLDVDHFKLVNDSWGHTTGDNLLVAIARRIEACLPETATFARLGGDEFAILLESNTEISDFQSEVKSIVNCIIEQFTPAFRLNERELFTSASIGIAFSCDRYQAPEELLRDADIAMYRAKQSLSADKVAIFDQAMHELVLARHGLESGLRQAIREIWQCQGVVQTEGMDSQIPNQLELHYQPIVTLDTRKIIGFEALLRWQHPERGQVGPDQFIPVAEETGLIIPLGNWVMLEACGQLRQWHQQLGDESLMMSINVSGRQLLRADFVKRVARLLAESQLPPSCIKLEITETALISAATVVRERLQALRELGVHLSLDDFGTGYSSLSYLHQFPVNTLKIDRSFIMDLQPGQDQVTRAMVALSKGFGLATIAEGIETEGQLAQLEMMGCEFGQGYLFSRPVDRAGAEALLLNQP